MEFDPYLTAFMALGAAVLTGVAVWTVWLVAAVAALARAVAALARALWFRLRPPAPEVHPADEARVRGWFAPHTEPGGEGR
jgi:cell division protein FtsW (lipid II flippase)